VAENIVFGLKVRACQGREGRAARAVAGLVGLSEQLARKPSQLSGGQRQRVALARAVIAENRICLMDEPLSNLDAQLRHGMRVEIRALQQRLDMTVVYVTHDQIEAMSMADRIVLMREGRIEQEGTPEDLYARPATIFAARSSHAGDEPRRARDGPHGAVIRGAKEPVLRGRGAGLTFGVRPEHVRLVDAGGVSAEVTSAEYHGADTIITARVGQESVLAVTGQSRLAAACKCD